MMEREGRILLVVAAPFYGRLVSDERFVQLVLLLLLLCMLDHCGCCFTASLNLDTKLKLHRLI